MSHGAFNATLKRVFTGMQEKKVQTNLAVCKLKAS